MIKAIAILVSNSLLVLLAYMPIIMFTNFSVRELLLPAITGVVIMTLVVDVFIIKVVKKIMNRLNARAIIKRNN